VLEFDVTGRLAKAVPASELPLLTCRKCETRWVPRRGADGKRDDIARH
jgi:hypothetical protein